MYVVKRDSRKEPVKFDKITARIIKMCYGLDPLVSPEAVAMKVIEGIYDGVTTTDLDDLAAEVAAAKTIDHPDYALLASRIAVSNLHKDTKKTFSEVMGDLYNYIDPKTGENAALLSEEVFSIIMENKDLLEVADALTDILYVTYGAGHAFGIDLDKCFQEVQNSNMSKLGENGKPIFNESGKVMKGPNYFKPNLTKFVN